MTLERTAERLEALGHPTRLAVYRLLVRAGHDGLAVGDLQERVGIPLSTLSHHLRKLVLVDLVTQERRGTTLLCRANYQTMRAVLGFMTDECCADVKRGEAS
jgi:ArsR family transcriptional regulator